MPAQKKNCCTKNQPQAVSTLLQTFFSGGGVGEVAYKLLLPGKSRRISPKLSARYYRPFLVVVGIGEVAYKLLLPGKSSIHPRFHVSQLKMGL